MSRETDFDEAQRSAVYRAIFERRDVRSYLPDPVPEDVLRRVLEAAHRAPSVGFMQPWTFLVVRDLETRRRIHAHFIEVNGRAAAIYEDDQRRTYQALKLQGILDAPLNVLVTCDPARAGEHVLGRFTMPETDVYSTCLAVQNLWLAARVEGLGVGWMSIMEKSAVREILGVPESIEPVAYLTLGYPVEFARAPLLSEVGWRQRLPLDDVIFVDRWGQRPSTSRSPVAPRAATLSSELSAAPAQSQQQDELITLAPPAQAEQRNRDLTKPYGSLGVIEQLTLKLAGLQQSAYPNAEPAHLTLFAADHGVARRRVSAYKRETTLKMVYSYLAGGAVANALTRAQSIALHVIDVGVDHDFAGAQGLLHRKVARGTRDFCEEAAMSAAECQLAQAHGADVVRALPELSVLLLGEMGIGNSTSAAVLTAGLLSLSPEQSVGPGTGVSQATRQRKLEAVEAALRLHLTTDPDELLRRVGGFEIAAMVGAIEAACARRALVLLDGFITGVAALVAALRTPAVKPFLVASHLSAEPGHAPVLSALALRPLLALDMRLGEGSGAALAYGLLSSGCRVMREVRTFEEANIDRPEDG
jgi:nicotinate-nucleotide--dimethylbenzimidazole phosphoribosyltransferase